MPDQEHLILVLAREAEVITHDMSVFFAPARDFIEPGADWPQDLTPGEVGGADPTAAPHDRMAVRRDHPGCRRQPGRPG